MCLSIFSTFFILFPQASTALSGRKEMYKLNTRIQKKAVTTENKDMQDS